MRFAIQALIALCLGATVAHAASSGQFRLARVAAGSGGGGAASESFRQSSLAGQPAIGTTSGGALVVRHGFRAAPGFVPTAVEDPASGVPRAHRLDGAFPNPFNPATRVHYELSEQVRARLLIYDLRGRLVRTLVDEKQQPGRHERLWDGRTDGGATVPSGTYLLRMAAGSYTARQKLTLLK